MAAVPFCGATAAEPPRSHLEPAGGVANGPPTFASLGLTLTRASAVLRQQLAIKRGAGLVVESVALGSRAARAGFAQHDVLVKLDDQLLLLPEQLDALLESAEPDAPLVALRVGVKSRPACKAARRPEPFFSICSRLRCLCVLLLRYS